MQALRNQIRDARSYWLDYRSRKTRMDQRTCRQLLVTGRIPARSVHRLITTRQNVPMKTSHEKLNRLNGGKHRQSGTTN